VIDIATQMDSIPTDQNVQASMAALGLREPLLGPLLDAIGLTGFKHGAEPVPLGEDHARSARWRWPGSPPTTTALSAGSSSGHSAPWRRPSEAAR
jgi:hypothetical protein